MKLFIRIFSIMCFALFLHSMIMNAQTVSTVRTTGDASAKSNMVPHVVKYSGALPITRDTADGATTQVTFSLYSEQNGGNPLWSEIHTVTLDAQGHYSVVLGSTTREGMPEELFTGNNARWLAVKADGQAESARSLLVSVPYALKALEAERLGGRTASDYISQSQLDEAVKAAVVRQATSVAITRERDISGPFPIGTSLTNTMQPRSFSCSNWGPEMRSVRYPQVEPQSMEATPPQLESVASLKHRSRDPTRSL